MDTEVEVNAIFTAAACAYIKKIIDKEAGMGFRLSIKKTGCSGYSYFPEVIHDINPKDISFEIESGVKVFIDMAWIDLLKDIYVDYVEDEKAGLKQKRLVFTNPKEGDRCGCGESFHIE